MRHQLRFPLVEQLFILTRFAHSRHALEKQERLTLSLIRQEKSVDRAYELAQQFVIMVKERNPKPMDTWLWDCQMSEINELVTFAQGLEKEGSALHAASTLPYSNGPSLFFRPCF